MFLTVSSPMQGERSRRWLRRMAFAAAALGAIGICGFGASPANASSTPNPNPNKTLVGVPQGGSYTPTGAEQSAQWAPAQAAVYATKLRRLSIVSASFGTPAPHAYMPAGMSVASSSSVDTCCGPPISYSIPIYNDPEPNSYYGYQCGPAAGHNALGAYSANVDIGAGSYPNASGLTQEMQTTSSQGTGRANMPGPLNSHQSQNSYLWQTLGSPAGNPNGVNDLKSFTVTDIWAGDSPIYNIETYGYDPIVGTYRHPFQQYSNSDIQHYVTSYAYRSSGLYISISDSAVEFSYTGHQEYEQYYEDIWAVIHNHPALDAILW